jgi:hypothetical protein
MTTADFRDWNFADEACSECHMPRRTHIHLVIDPAAPRTIVRYYDETESEARHRSAAPKGSARPDA